LCSQAEVLIGRMGLGSGEGGESGLHFVAGMGVSCFLGDDDARGEDAFGFIDSAGLGEELAVLKISGDIGGVVSQQLLEVGDRGGVVAEAGAFERQSIAGEGISRIGGKKGFEFLATAGGGWAHGRKAGIITAEAPAFKS